MKKSLKYSLIICTVLLNATFWMENIYQCRNGVLSCYPIKIYEDIHSSYSPHAPLIISSNSQFDLLANSHGWDGNGSEVLPYIIEGYEFTGGFQLVEIQNTDRYFILRNNLINGENFLLDGIYFLNVANGQAYNNTIINNRHGIYLDTGCSNNIIQQNLIYDSAQSGIRLNHTNLNLIIENEVYNNVYNGIWLNSSNNNIIHNNTVYNHGIGFWLRDDSNHNNITYNSITDSDNSVLLSNYSSENKLLGNLMTNFTQCGIKVSDFANNNDFLNNSMENLISYGAILNFSTFENYFKGNNFINNNGAGTSQAYDNGTNNIFEYNYWADWISPDLNPPYGIVDIPYDIDGLSNNNDSFPLTIPVSTEAVHFVSAPVVIYPNGGETINGSTLIQWSTSTDSYSHSVKYNIFYSENGGSDWFEIASDITLTSFYWDTSSLNHGIIYKIKVLANCSDGLISGDESDGVFTVQMHHLTTPSILNPTNSQIVKGYLNIVWTPSVDSWERDITYTLFYSNDSQNWIEIVSEVNVTNFLWNATNIENGTDYQIKVKASSSDDFYSETISGFFSIENGLIDDKPAGFDIFFVLLIAASVGGAALLGGLFVGYIIGRKGKPRADDTIQPHKDAIVKEKDQIKPQTSLKSENIKKEDSANESEDQKNEAKDENKSP